MSQNDQVPAGTENYPVNNYIPKSNPNSRPKKFTKYAYVVKNQVVWDLSLIHISEPTRPY